MDVTLQYDVFLSYHAPDRQAVAYLAQRLQQVGIRPWLDAWALQAGETWMPRIEQAIVECSACIVFIGPHGLGDWQQQEAQVAIRRSVSSRNSFPVIPVVLPGAPHKIPQFLDNFNWVEFAETVEDEAAFQRLVQGIRAGSQAPVSVSTLPSSTAPTPVAGSVLQGWTNIPAPLTPLLGREMDLQVLEPLLRDVDARLVTLTGPGGIGKTRLAIAAARQVGPAFPDGMCYVSLATISDSALVAPAIAQALAVAEQSDLSLAASITARLRDQALLLVLDNFEQVIDAADLVRELLSNAANLHILVTSREPLHLLGEHRYVVAPLAIPTLQAAPVLAEIGKNPAITLFVQRAHALQPQFALSPANLPVIVDICTRLEGIPLAIELVAAQLRGFLGPTQILARLKEFMLTGTDRARDRELRHQTMETTIAWSYSLLTQPEQRLFACLGVFSGGFSPEATAMIVEAEQLEHVDELLQSLIEKSLVQDRRSDDQPTRLIMLEIILEFARARLEEREDANLLHKRHAEFFLQLAERAFPNLSGPAQKQLMDELAQEQDNLHEAARWLLANDQALQALRLTGALWRFWYNRGYLAEGQRQISLALTQVQAELAHSSLHSNQEVGAVLALALDGLGSLAQKQGDYRRAMRSYREALVQYQQLENTQEIAHTLYRLGLATMHAGDKERARIFLEKSLAVHTSLQNTLGAARAHNNLGMLAHYSGNYDTARHHYTQSLVLLRELGDQVNIAIGLGNIGEVAFLQGDLATAQASFIDSLGMCNQLDDPEGIAYCLDWLAQIAAAQKDLLNAAQLWGAAAALRALVGIKLAPADQTARLESIASARAQVEEAAWEAAWEAGCQISREQAVAVALNLSAG